MRIDPDTKRKQAERIRRALTKELFHLGFKRFRRSNWIREREHIIQRIHLHVFTFDTSFRVHLSVHVKDSDDQDQLNGLSSFDGWYRHHKNQVTKPRKYVFHFNRMANSVDHCVSELFAYCRDVAEPWFDEHNNLDHLLNDSDSPLSEDAKGTLRNRLGV